MNAIADATSSQASEAEQTSFDMDELALSIEEIHKEIELMNGYVGQSQSSNVHNSEMMFHVFESWEIERQNQAELVESMNDMNEDVQSIGKIVQLHPSKQLELEKRAEGLPSLQKKSAAWQNKAVNQRKAFVRSLKRSAKNRKKWSLQ